jgi:hypothetical protein
VPDFPLGYVDLSPSFIIITFIWAHLLWSKCIHNFVKAIPGLVNLPICACPIAEGDFKPHIKCLPFSQWPSQGH